MPLPRSTIGTVLMGGAPSATLAALVYPGMLGVQNVSSDPSRMIANPAPAEHSSTQIVALVACRRR
ncbi:MULTISPECIES: hypothetical protein [Streptomyces]|uniref:hypothetical protein n=1 Tax=Streptomyces TaxID=1883 RepID=UPI0031DF1D76